MWSAVTGAVGPLKQSVKKLVNIQIPRFMLFNAYTEKKFIDHIKDYELSHMDGIYADSGGLQMVTTGNGNAEIKDGTHDVQTFPMQCVLMISFRTRVISSYT